MSNVTSGYLAGVDLPGIEKTEESEMLIQMAMNKNSMSLAFPQITSQETILKILTAHNNGQRCFVNIELEQIADDDVPEIEGFPYRVVKSDVRYEVDAAAHAKLVSSAKLEAYVKNYKMENQLPCVIWSRVPYTCYTILILQPWLQ